MNKRPEANSRRRATRRAFRIFGITVGGLCVAAAAWRLHLSLSPESGDASPRSFAAAAGPAASAAEPAPRSSAPHFLAGTVAAPIPADAPLPPAKRTRVAALDPLWLDGKRSPLFGAAAKDAVVPLALWDDLVLPVRLTGSTVIGQRRHLVEGTIDGRPDSRFLLTTTGEAMAFSVYAGPGERYGGFTLEDGSVAIYELDAEAMAGCGGAVPAVIDASAVAAAAVRAAMRDEAPHDEPATGAAAPLTIAEVDVLFIYTSEVGGATPSDTFSSRVDLAVAEANNDFSRSETRVRVRRVGLQQTVYTETGNNGQALSDIREIGVGGNVNIPGPMDEIHAKRDQLGADLVCLIVQRADPTSIGIAYILDEQNGFFNDVFGFSLVQNSVLTGTSTFSHEIGHNFGCAHDREHSSSPGIFSYSYGHRLIGTNGITYRTIMAYQPGTAINYFSNPRLTPASVGVPIGVNAGSANEADNATSINRTVTEISAYRLNALDPVGRGQLVNVSTRALVRLGDEVLIGGFVIGAPNPKQVLVRGVGPSMANFGVSGTLSNPQLTLVNQNGGAIIATNTDWGLAPDPAAITATGYAPSDSREAAILMTLNPGAYTALVSGENNVTGIGLVEVYEVVRSDPKLVNLSTRGYVGTGDNVMIGGLVINGNAGETKRILVRGLGPWLNQFNVPGTLFDPAIVLYNQAGDALVENDDWDTLPEKIQDQIRALGLPPSDRLESALLIDLPPGIYTVIMRPFENDDGAAPGIGLIEAYEITQ